MKKIRLGKTNLEVSQIGMGGIPLTRPSEAESIRLIQKTLDLGVNFIDTAFAYGEGMSEERIGKAIAARREDVIIATKGGHPEQIDISLQRLNTDYIDIWQFHSLSSDEYYEEVFKPGGLLEDVKAYQRAGKVRHIGFSSHRLDVAIRAVNSDAFSTVQFPLNFVSDEALDELLPLSRKHDLGFIAMKPFAGGRIKSANLAIKYLLQFDDVMPDPGIETYEEIEEIVNIANQGSWEFTPDERSKIETIKAHVGKRFCRQCRYCTPCPENVMIYGAIYLSILWELWPPDWFFSSRYVQESVDSARNCTQCGECETKCPYNLSIREMITENLEFYDRVSAEHNHS